MTILWTGDEDLNLLKALSQVIHANDALPVMLERMLVAYSAFSAAQWWMVLLVSVGSISRIISSGDKPAQWAVPFSLSDLPCWEQLTSAQPVMVSATLKGDCHSSLLPSAANETHLYIPIGSKDNLYGVFVIGAAEQPNAVEIKRAQIFTVQAELAIHHTQTLRTAQVKTLNEYYEWLKLRIHSSVDQALSSAASLTSLIARLMVKNPGDALQYLDDLEELVRIAITDTHSILTEFRGRVLIFSDEAHVDESTEDKGAVS
jgi:hypothetical protein